MPVTPFHLGPGLFFGTIFKRLNLLSFLLGNVILDIEPFFAILYNLNYPYNSYPHHGIIHSLFGAFFASLLLAMFLSNFKNPIQRILKKFKLEQNSSLLALFSSSFLGCACHLLFDSFLHRDVFPLWPSKFNPLLGLISVSQVYFLCVILGLIGTIFLFRKIKSS